MTILEKLEKLIYEGFKDTDRKFQDTDRKFQDTDRKFQDTDRKFQEMREDFQDTDRKFQETHREFQEIKESFRESRKMVDALTGKWGRFVEGLVIPAMERMFEERGIEITEVSSRAKSSRNGNHMEIDIVGVSDEYVILVEVKSTLSVKDVDEHLERLKNFKKFFHRFDDCKVIGAVAGIVIENEADVYAYRKGLFVIAQSGDSVKILNDDKFTPTIW